MKTRILALGVAALFCGLQTVNASIDVGDYVKLYIGHGAVSYADGGEFFAEVYGHNADGSMGTLKFDFYTFCADSTQFFYPGHTYKVEANSTAIFEEEYAAFANWLFYQYWTNDNANAPADLTGYVPGHEALSNTSNDFGSLTNQQVAGAIQAEIWAALDKPFPTGYYPSFAQLKAAAEIIFGWDPDDDTYLVGQVNVLTLRNLSLHGIDDPAQPQLYVPSVEYPSNPEVPEPAAIIVWLLLGTGSWLGMRVWRGRDRIFRPAWSPENREAIYEIIARHNPH